MKKFKDFVKEEGEGAVPANAVGPGEGVAGLTGDPPVYPEILRFILRFQRKNKKNILSKIY